ncbi:MAG: phospholipase D-like domain-containing protein [Anaerovoracaceae bacterium]|jgi:HKD family nuclease|nr:phospholipase D-like domain-containing protein [Anaerovoracaceae bacterium]
MGKLIDNDDRTLEQALKNVLPQAESIDILTAYFYFSGFSMLAEELKDKKIRILVGKAIDPNAITELSAAMKYDQNVSLDPYVNRKFATMNRTQRKKEYTDSFVALYNKSSLSSVFDGTDDQKMQHIFERKLKEGTLEIRLTNEPNHAKTYILKNKLEFTQNGDYEGNVFMGSSNFTYSGLTGQGELNDSYKALPIKNLLKR